MMNAKVEASRTSGGRVPSLQEVAQSMMNATADKDSFIEKEYEDWGGKARFDFLDLEGYIL